LDALSSSLFSDPSPAALVTSTPLLTS
jgi:hypothetical protein